MSKTLYLDCFSGISGDMALGALIDLGFPPSALEWELSKLEIGDFHLHTDRQSRKGISGIRFTVHDGAVHRHDQDEHDHEKHDHEEHHDHGHEHHHHHEHGEHEGCCGGHGHEHEEEHGHEHKHEHKHEHHHHEQGEECCGGHHHHDEHDHGRSYADIRKLIESSTLSEFVKTKSLAVFERIAQAEGKIHGVPTEKVTFHEVGALDSIVDIVGFCAGVEHLGIAKVFASKLETGSGWVKCAHGKYPVPAPATAELLAGMAWTHGDEKHELLTPTGAALLAEFATLEKPAALNTERIGYGLGKRDLESRPNVLRAMLCGPAAVAANEERDEVICLETNLDDLTPELAAGAASKLLAEGALDAWLAPVQMKKGRPGFILGALIRPGDLEKFSGILLRETSAFGVRFQTLERIKLSRTFKDVDTAYGKVTVKIGTLGGDTLQIAPEYESARQAAEKAGVPVRTVYDAAIAAFKRA